MALQRKETHITFSHRKREQGQFLLNTASGSKGLACEHIFMARFCQTAHALFGISIFLIYNLLSQPFLEGDILCASSVTWTISEPVGEMKQQKSVKS